MNFHVPNRQRISKKITQDSVKTGTSGTPTEQDLVRAGALIARERNFKDLITVFVEQAQDVSRAEVAAFYGFRNMEDRKSDLKLVFKRGSYELPEIISGSAELVCFLRECRETLVFNNKYTEKADAAASYLKEVLIHPAMKSGMALPIITPPREIGILFVASRMTQFFNRAIFYFLDSYTKLAAGAMQTSLLFDETKTSLQKIDALERYQENVFNSMTSMIITTDPNGRIYYFNEPAAETMGLKEDDLGRNLIGVLKRSIASETLDTIAKSLENGNEIIGLEGIYNNGEKEMDYSLNLTPLRTPRGRKEGFALLFTNQTRENELKQTVQAVSEERRVIKNAFSRILSPKVIDQIVADPSQLKLGGEKRKMTAIFTDIQRFSSISSELQDQYGEDGPKVLVDLLNLYLTEMSNVVLDNGGTIDKYEGDAIIGFFGAPAWMEDHAAQACRSAILMKRREIEIVENVMKPDGEFFNPLTRLIERNVIRKLRPLYTRLGINTGDMVVGFMGTPAKMDYTIMGNAVNLAARLEGVNKQYDTHGILISEYTRDQIGDEFVIRPLSRVTVVGIPVPLRLFELLEMKSDAPQSMLDMVNAWEGGFKAYENRDFEGAKKTFAEIYQKDSEDATAKLYVERCEKFIASPPPKEWDGVDNLTEK
jgi:adenylate cyclase